MNKKQRRKYDERPNLGGHRMLSRIASYMERMLTDDLRERYGIKRGDSMEARVAAIVRALLISERERAQREREQLATIDKLIKGMKDRLQPSHISSAVN